jgi:Xaa-Pro aminopeptidase
VTNTPSKDHSADPYDRIPIRNGYPSFSPDEIKRRHAALRGLLQERKLDCALLCGPGRFNQDIMFMTNWPGGREGYFLLPTQGEPALLMQLFNHVHMAKTLSLVPDTRWAGPDSIVTVAAWLRDAGLAKARIGLIGSLSFSQFEKLQKELPEAVFSNLSGPFRQMRLIRSDEEIEFFRVAGALTDRSLVRMQAALKPGLREYELAAILEAAYLEVGGFTGIHFMASTPMANPNVFVPHQYQSDRVLQEGDALISEISGAFWGYSGQIHRTFFLGEPTKEYAHLHETAVLAYEAIESVLRDGATVEDVLDAAEIIHERGYTICDDLFHGANQYPPILRTRRTDHGYPKGFVFKENMVVTIQPQPTTEDRRMGLQFGETVRIVKNGVEKLHDFPRQPVVVKSAALAR